jgi:hypothetical protein
MRNDKDRLDPRSFVERWFLLIAAISANCCLILLAELIGWGLK